MAKHMTTEDFRAVRWILEPDDFAGGDDGPEIPPRDLIDLKTWRSIVTFPDDVAIRTSNHGGGWLKILDEWHSDLTCVGISVADNLNLSDTPLGAAIFNCHDDYHAGLFDALTGFYRTAHSCLRNCLEYLTVGLYFELTGDMGRFRDWEAGNEEIMFGKAADLLGRMPAVQSLETHLMGQTADNLLRPRNSTTGDHGGLLRRTYRDLSAYVHGTPGKLRSTSGEATDRYLLGRLSIRLPAILLS